MTEANTPPPRPSNQLTPAQIDQASQWLREHWKALICPFHGPTNWQVQQYLTSTPLYASGVTILGGPAYPFLVVMCSICGYTVFVNAIVVGLVPSAPLASESNEKEAAV